MSVDNNDHASEEEHQHHQGGDTDRQSIRRKVLSILFPKQTETAGKQLEQDSTCSDDDTDTSIQCDEESQRPYDTTTIATVDSARPCAICLEPVPVLGVSGGSCRHYFHYDCLMEWMMTNEDSNCCPTCRQPLYDTDLYNEQHAQLSNSSNSSRMNSFGTSALPHNDTPVITVRLASQRPMSKLAQTAVACGLFGIVIPLLSVMAVVFGVIALWQIHQARYQVKGNMLAVAGVGVGVLGLLFRSLSWFGVW